MLFEVAVAASVLAIIFGWWSGCYSDLLSGKELSLKSPKVAAFFGMWLIVSILFIAAPYSAQQELNEANAAVARSRRDLWQSAQNLPIGYEITTQCLDQLKAALNADPAGMLEALGENELRVLQERFRKNDEALAKRKELNAEIDSLVTEIDSTKKDLAQLRATADKTIKDAEAFAAIADRYSDAIVAAKAAAEQKRRIAPAGDYSLKVDFSRPDENFELALLSALVHLECLSKEDKSKTGEHYEYRFEGVTKEYADNMGARFREAGANISIEKAAK